MNDTPEDKPAYRSAARLSHGAPRATATPRLPPKQTQAPQKPASKHPAPRVLMSETAAPTPPPTNNDAAHLREKLRTLMRTHRLTPTTWAARANIPAAPLLAFLTGRSMALPPGMLEKLATAANTTPADILR